MTDDTNFVPPENTTDEPTGQTKHIEGHLVVNWHDEAVRYRKTSPDDDANPHELTIPIDITITIPEVSVPTIDADITVPQADVEHAVIDDETSGEHEALGELIDDMTNPTGKAAEPPTEVRERGDDDE